MKKEKIEKQKREKRKEKRTKDETAWDRADDERRHAFVARSHTLHGEIWGE